MPTTPGGRWSPSDSDEWDLTTDLATMQVSNETATANALAALPQNYRVGTNSQRLALPVAQLYKGLRFYATDTDMLWKYNGTVWLRDVRVATWTVSRSSPPNDTVIGDLTLTQVAARTTDTTFYSSVSASQVTVPPGLYVVTFTIGLGSGNSATSRSFLEIDAGGETYRAAIPVSEDTATVTAQFNIADTRNIRFQVYKRAGSTGTPLSGTITIRRIDY